MTSFEITVPAKAAVKMGWTMFWLGLRAAIRRDTVTYSLSDETRPPQPAWDETQNGPRKTTIRSSRPPG